MTTSCRVLAVGLFLAAASALDARAADVPPGIQTSARCAPRARMGSIPDSALRIIGTQDSVQRTLFGPRDLLIVGGGTERGVQIGQQFIIRRDANFGHHSSGNARAIGTGGWLRIVAANETTAIGMVEFACDGINLGDFLEPYIEPVLPPNVDRTDAAGEPDFNRTAHVLFGDNERLSGGVGDFMVIDAGLSSGAEPGVRFAIYRDAHVPGVPLAPVGEAIVVHSDADTAVVRLTLSRDVVQQGDLMVPRKH
jgi:hypothetical protein